MLAAEKSNATRSETILHLQQAFKLALSLVLYYWLALWVNWDEPQYGALAIVIISLGTSGASIETGIMRFVGTTAGVAVGFLVIGLFNHDRWATMLALAAYLTAMGYFMQTSRYRYAWYAAAFIPLTVWADNYPRFENAFYFGTFRYLTTTAGMLIYTMVDLVFWARHAGKQLKPLGRDLWAEVQVQFRNCRLQLSQGQPPKGAADLRTKVAGTLSRTLSTLQDAYFDTPEVSGQKKVWEVWRLNTRALLDALELWRESIDDCRELDLDRLVPTLSSGLDTLDKRLARIADLWSQGQLAEDSRESDDGTLMETLTPELNRPAFADLSHFDRAALMSFLGQLELLNRASCEVLRTMRVLAGIDSSGSIGVSSRVRDLFRPSRWDPGRLINALFPAAAFVAAFFVWVIINPPGGPKLAMFAAILALLILRTPMKPLPLWLLMLLSTVMVVAPVYWLVMPTLSTGFGLLSLIFIYSFVFGFLGGRSPALKAGPIIMFVTSTGISNQQSYSFQALVTGAQMTLYGGIVMTMVFYMFSRMRPEQALLRSLRRFFRGCGRVMRGFDLDPSPAERVKGRRLRKRYLESMVLPAPAHIQSAQKDLDYKRYPDNSSEKVQRLYNSVQSIGYRLEALEISYDRITHHGSQLPESLIPLRKNVRETVARVFDRWAELEPGDAFEEQQTSLQQLSIEVQRQFDALHEMRDRDPISDTLLAELYTMLGSTRGLIAAMANAQSVINQINWPQWARRSN